MFAFYFEMQHLIESYVFFIDSLNGLTAGINAGMLL